MVIAADTKLIEPRQLPVDVDGSVIGVVNPTDGAQERALPGTVAPKETHELSRGHRQVNVGERLVARRVAVGAQELPQCESRIEDETLGYLAAIDCEALTH